MGEKSVIVALMFGVYSRVLSRRDDARWIYISDEFLVATLITELLRKKKKFNIICIRMQIWPCSRQMPSNLSKSAVSTPCTLYSVLCKCVIWPASQKSSILQMQHINRVQSIVVDSTLAAGMLCTMTNPWSIALSIYYY